MIVSSLIFAGIVAKGLGILAGIFGFGLLVGIVLTTLIATRLRRRRGPR